MSLKLALMAGGLLLVVSAFFYGVSVGKKNQKVIYQDRIIEAGNRHAEIEKRQTKHVSYRGQRLHISELQRGSF